MAERQARIDAINQKREAERVEKRRIEAGLLHEENLRQQAEVKIRVFRQAKIWKILKESHIKNQKFIGTVIDKILKKAEL